MGNHQLAADYYQRIASAKFSKYTDDPAQLAKRALNRLNSTGIIYYPSAEKLAEILKTAIEEKDTIKLSAMISKTHFAIGVAGSETVFEDPALVDVFLKELRSSRVKVNVTLLGSGEKRYIPMSGFKGKSFRGHTTLLITKAPGGWQWTSIVLQTPTKYWAERWTTGSTGTVGVIQSELEEGPDSVPFEILAPWPKPICFTAGGLEYFLTMESIVVAGGLFGFVLATILATKECCGYGPRGYYYNTAPTHEGTDSFAIDFTRYKENVPYVNESGGTHVLAVREGVVSFVRALNESGSSSQDNRVEIHHDDPANRGDPAHQFTSRYLHLAGPFSINVSEQMPLRLGTFLGLMDDTGNSALDHLHFSIHNPNGQSVRPSPMGSVILGDDNSGRCVKSTNIEHKGTNFMLTPSNYVSQNWIISPAGLPVNEAAPISVNNQQFVLILTGVAVIDYQGVNSEWASDTVLLQPDIFAPVFYAVDKYQFSIPADVRYTPQFEVDQYALHATLSSIYNKDESVNAGYAVDNWQAHPFVKDTDVITGASLSNLFSGVEVDVAVSDSDGHILRLSYHITLLGKIRFGQTVHVL